MKKQYIVLLTGICLILLFVFGVFLYKNHQIKKYGFMARKTLLHL